MRIVLDPQFLEDLRWWSVTRPIVLRTIFALMDATLANPRQGLGDPMLLHWLGRGFWSREIDVEHDLVYLYELDQITFLRCREPSE